MPDISNYCAYCGAANAAENQVCFACQRPLTEQDTGTPGTVLNGRYQLLTRVGSGGFGGVYRAIDLAQGRKIVAVKEISLRGLSTQEAIEATDGFNREVRLLSTLRHPNLPLIHDTFMDAEHWYLIMDFIEGETLEAYLQHTAQDYLSLKETLEIGLQLCTVLNYLHTREPAVIFRDLKPSNVMRTVQGRIYLIDFGIARHFSPGKPKDTMPFGSPGYAAPEQYGRAQTTPQADIYSLGALLHHLITGNDPAESPFRFAPLPIANSLELADLDRLIQRMVATASEERPANTYEVQAILQRLLDELNPQEPQPFAPAPPVRRAVTSRRSVLSSALKIGGAVVGGVVALTVCGEVLLDVIQLQNDGIHNVTVGPSSYPGTVRNQFIYRGHKGPITALSWSPDATMVASGSADGTVQIWRAADGALLYTLSGYKEPVTSVSWASDRVNVIASAGNNDGTVQVWEALREHRDLNYHGGGRVLALDWQGKSPWIVSGGTDKEIYVWNASTGKKATSYRGHQGDVTSLTWLPNPNPFSRFSTPVDIMPSAGTPRPLMGPGPLDTPTPPSTPAPANTPPPTPAPTQILSPVVHKNVIVSGGADHLIQIWDGDTGAQIATYNWHSARINSVAFIPGRSVSDEAFIASASDDGTVQLWTLDFTGAITLHASYTLHHSRVNAVTALFTPDLYPAAYYGTRIASAGDDGTVQIWATNYYERALITYTAHQAPVKALASSPLDDRVVSGDSKGLVHLWSVSEPEY